MHGAGARHVPVEARAWGADGHKIIADIAEAHLTQEAGRRVAEILQGVRMRDVSNYADEVRPSRRETSRWHYVNIEPGAADYVPARDCRQIAGQGDCIINAIERNIATLRAGGEGQGEALKFLIHFTGDVHQPFHAVAEARGGNEIPVTFLGVASNLHRVWDSDLIRSTRRDPSEYARALDAELIVGRELPALTNGTVVDWVLSSREQGHVAMVDAAAKLDDAYVSQFLPVMNEQLALAGIRLAFILNDLFK